MPWVRPARLSARSTPRLRACAAISASIALTVGLLATPTGAVAAATPSATPEPTVSAEPSATPEPTDSAAPTPSADPEPAAPEEVAPSEEPVPAPAEPTAPASDSSVAEEAPAEEDTPPAEADDEPPVFSRLLADIGILAAGVPEQPTQVWLEAFEDGLNTTTPTGIGTYGSSRYTSTGWASGTNCTGVLVNYTATYPNTSFCPSQTAGTNTLAARDVRRMADVLGQVAAGVVGSTSATAPTSGSTATTRTNHALTSDAYAAATGTTVIQSAAGVGVTASGPRYYTMRFDAVGAQCGTNNASLSLGLVSGTTTLLNAFPTAVVPCTATGTVFYTSNPTLTASGGVLDPAWGASVRAATYTGSASALLTADQIRTAQVRLLNTVTAAGSAFGVDNLRILDATPSLDWSFSPSSVPAGTSSTLTYTITNTAELAAKTDWSFTNTLPAGLVVAAAPAVGGTCAQVTGTAFAVTATAGSSSISAVGGDLAATSASCTITVSVVSTTEGSYVNSPSNVTTVLAAPEAATLTVTPASRITVRKDLTARTSPSDQFTLSLRSGSTVIASATTTGTATGIQAAQVSRVIVQPSTTYTVHETPTSGAGLGYASAYECTRDGTVVASGASRAGTITMPDDQGAEIVCTFTNSPQTVRLACDTNRFYAVTAAGAMIQGDIVSGAQTTVGTWSATAANALGVGAQGSLAYAVNRSTDAADVVSMLKWTPSGGFETLGGTAYTAANSTGTAIPGSIVAGAVDLTNNRYIFGKFNGGLFHLWSFTESNPPASRYAYLGSFTTGSAPNGNGDMAFDSRGNLYVLGAATVNNASSAAIFTITAETLAAASGGTLAVNTSTTKALTGLDASPAFGSVNGIAFSPRGTVYLSSSTSTYEFDPTSWTRVSGSPRLDLAATDLATCTGPGTVSVLKNVVGRLAAADQFQLSLADSTGTVGTATTTGATTGRQAAQIGPFPVRVGTALTISESMATGSSSVIGAYTILYECWTDGVRIASGTSASGALTMPDRFGANVVCTFFNSPRPASTVTITKRLLDPVTGQSQPAAGWTVGTSAVATVGTATVLPSEAPRQTTDSAGTATWSVLFGSTASRATLTVLEVQQTRFTFVSGACTVNGAAVAVTFTTSGGVVSGSIPGVASASTVACTFVNQPVTSLTLVKAVSYGSALPTDWVLVATAPSGALAGPTGRSGAAATTAVPVSPGRAYRLSESGGPATYVQVGPWRCADSTGAAVAVSAAGDVTLATGADVTCTVTNATASLTLLKQVINPQAGFRAPDWTLIATPAPLAGATLPTQTRVGAEYSASGNPNNTFDVRPGHTYVLNERPTTPGSRLAYQTLRFERLVGSTWTPVSSDTITAPAAGETAIYRYVNAPVTPPTLPLTGGPSTDAYLMAGSTVLLLALVLALWYGRRNSRRRSETS